MCLYFKCVELLVLTPYLHYLKTGWPAKVPDALKPYFTCHDELSIEESCILRGIRVIVPKKLQSSVLDQLHEGHVGMVKNEDDCL